MRSGVQVQIELRRVVQDLIDLIPAAINAVGDPVAISIEMPVVEEVNPMPAILVTRGVVQMESGHVTREPIPLDVVADPLMFSVKIKTGDAPTVMISTILELITAQLNQELPMVLVVRSGDFLR
ncbi:MAG TPA: hypothetical protein VF788_05305 [Pseudonocardiaceae bacterium]